MKLTASLACAVVATAATSQAAQFRAGQQVMGTVLQVTVIADGSDDAREAAEEAIREARRWDDILTTWRPEGELARLNRNAGGPEVGISGDLRAALARMLTLVGDTGGAFDPGVGPAVASRRTGAPYSIARLQPLPIALQLGAGTAHLEKGAGIDPGAIGKGIALDAMADLLRQRAVHAAFLDFGGSSQLAIGAPPDSPEGWSVVATGLREGVIRGTITLRDCSLSTSRVRRADAAEGTIVDPRDGKVVATSRAVTVLYRNATEADAWSTALVVLGRQGIARAETSGMEVLFEDAAGAVKTGGFPLEEF